MTLRSARLGTPGAGSRTRKLLAAAFVAALAVAVPMTGAEAGKGKPETPSAKAGSQDISEKAGFYDSRQDPGVRKLLASRSAKLSASPKAGVSRLRETLGNQGIIDIDPLTGTARAVARLDGFLTPASRRPAPFIALNYLRANPDVFGLDAAAVARLKLRKDYRDISGTHHLSFIQEIQGIPVSGNGIKANVTKDGRLINVTGSPVSALPTAAASPGISASAAREASIKSVEKTPTAATATTAGDAVRTTTFSDGDRASLVYFITASGPRLAWQTLTTPSSKEMYNSIVAADNGKVLYRQSLVASDSGLAWDYYPGSGNGGGVQTLRTFPQSWLPNNSQTLSGNVAHVYSDVNDDNAPQPSEEIAPSGSKQFVYPFTNFSATVGGACAAQFNCSWDPNTPYSWQANRAQNAVQVLYYLGKYHDHLAAAPIGFTREAGNFEAVDGDAVQANTIDGADTADGLPDSDHTDNANMATPPDGIPPLMQMYLFPDPAAGGGDPFLASNGGDEADIIYHEYTHGLSNRLVVDALGFSTLGSVQAGSMGEAWSDWYAMDFLVNLGFQKDSNAPGEVRIGNYVGAGADLIRTQPMDCPVGSTSALCPGMPGKGGGYTYGDFGKIIGGPEVHADGEIWGETLWDLRKALGSKLAESLVTRAMELSPANPSFLDMRNAILMADQVVDKGRASKTIWKTFAARGMGYFAGALDGDDSNPVEDFSMPPAAGTPTGTLSGKVTDQDTGTAIANIAVGFGGHNSGFPGDYAATTDASGNYVIRGILPGTYPAVFARGNGYDRKTSAVSIAPVTNTLNWALRRDWAALTGGGSVIDFNGPDYTDYGCGPTAAIDQSLGLGWGSTSDITNGAVQPKFVTIELPVGVNIAEIAVDPGNTCGDAGSASTGAYSVETSVDGVTFVEAARGTFIQDDRHRLNSVPLNAGTTGNVHFVRFWMRGVQIPGGPGVCPGPYSGCDFMDMSEIEVFGAPAV